MYNGLFTWLLKNSLYLAEQCSNHNVPIFYCKQLLCHEPKLKKKKKLLKAQIHTAVLLSRCDATAIFPPAPEKHTVMRPRAISPGHVWKQQWTYSVGFNRDPTTKRERDEIKIPHRNAHKSITSLTYSKCSEPEPGLRTGSEFFPSPLHLILEFCKAPLNIVLKVIYKLISSLF